MTNESSTDRRPVTVIGLGLMGTALAGAFLRAGHPTTVWNRTSRRADALVAAGAIRATTVSDAVAASPLVITCVLNDDALHSVLEPAVGDLTRRALINLTSGTPEEARARADWAAEHDIEYLDGKILAFPSTIGTPEAFLLYSGQHEVFTAHEPTLATLGGATYLGADAGLASLYDLGLLSLMYGTMTGFLHSLAILRSESIEAEAFLPFATDVIAALPAFVAGIAHQVQTNEHGADGARLDMQAVYLEHMVDASERRGVDPTFPAYVKKLMDGAIAAGHGGDDVARLLDELATSTRTSA